MPYSTDLEQVQIGKEVTWGTAVTPTAKLGLIESCEITPEVEGESLPDIRGSLAGGYVQTLNKHSGSGSVQGTASYEDLQYWLESLFGIVTPSGAGPYVYAGVAPLTTVPTRRMLTVVKGQSGSVYKMAGGLVDELTISGESNAPWKFDAKLLGKVVSSGALAVLSDRTQSPIHANHTSLYIDAVGGTIGTTLINSAFFSFELALKANISLVPGVGSLNPVAYVDRAYTGSLKLSLEVDTTTAAYLASILGSSLLQQQVRIKATTGVSQIAQLDFAGGHLSAPAIFTDTDGVVSIDLEMERVYNSALGNWFKSSITNSVATLP